MARIRKHPGELLRTELDAREVSANQPALALCVPANRITGIFRGKRGITAETDVRLGRYLRTGAEFRMNLQAAYDISVVEHNRGSAIIREVQAG